MGCKWRATCMYRSQNAIRKEGIMSEDVKAECQLDAEDMAQERAASAVSESFHSASFIGTRNVLPSDVAIISPFVAQLLRFVSRFRAADESNFEIDLALREALANAIVHGNQEDPRKCVYINCRCTTAGEVSITVED